MPLELYHPGLNGVVAGETNICSLEGGLSYRGYDIFDLAEGASFLEVAHLLLFEELPNGEELADFRAQLMDEAELPSAVLTLYEQLPLHNGACEALRTGLCLLGQFDPQPDDRIVSAGRAQATRLLARVPLLIATWDAARNGLPSPRVADKSLNYASQLLLLLRGREASFLEERALNALLMVAAEQEFTPATFAARIAASTDADLYSAVTAALSTMAGRRHGGGNESILDLLDDLDAPESAADWVRRQFSRHSRLPGFGHPIHADCDPRATILERYCSELAEASGHRELEDKADAIERAVWEERQIPPNVDWPLIRLLHYLDVPPDLHWPVFVLARLTGWCAHAIEQAEEGTVLRPRARYRGVQHRSFEPLRLRD